MHKNKLLPLLFIIFTQSSLFGMEKDLKEAKRAAQLLEISDRYLATIGQSTLLPPSSSQGQIVRSETFQPHPAIAQLLNSIHMPTFIDRRYAQMCREARHLFFLLSREIPEVARYCSLVLQLMGKELARDGGQFGISTIQKLIGVGKQITIYQMRTSELNRKLVESYVSLSAPKSIEYKPPQPISQQKPLKLACGIWVGP